ncbi:hypothetical protein IWX47DRAFT_558658 [Phyllosticta citricarpa]|uniref:Uncharacterized protein n=1 Tax=Phyllosticta citricarpa TaxID=55181 RepID=A0ABR1LDK6_9PEZI
MPSQHAPPKLVLKPATQMSCLPTQVPHSPTPPRRLLRTHSRSSRPNLMCRICSITKRCADKDKDNEARARRPSFDTSSYTPSWTFFRSQGATPTARVCSVGRRQPSFSSSDDGGPRDGGSLGIFSHAASALRKLQSVNFPRPDEQERRSMSPEKRAGSPLKRMSTPGHRVKRANRYRSIFRDLTSKSDDPRAWRRELAARSSG